MKQSFLKFIIISVWLINGFFCKILNLSPRHQEIVAITLSKNYAREITFTIGFLEILMVAWIISSYKAKLNAISQIVIILTMNIVEFVSAKDLLLFGNLNSVFAIFFCFTIYYREFILKKYV